MPPGYHYRRGHWVKNPSRRGKGTSWVGLAVVVVIGWALLHGCGKTNASSDHPSSPSPAVSSTP